MSQAVKSALRHPDILGAGAKKRAHIRDPKKKIATVMEEYGRGTLRAGGSGKHVSNRKQAIAIAMSEAKKRKR